jgi:hypothetical protein
VNLDLIDIAQRQCWEAWRDRHKPNNGTLNRYCKILCNLPPPEAQPIAETAVIVEQDISVGSKEKSDNDSVQLSSSVKPRSKPDWSPLIALVVLFSLLYAAQQFELDQQGSGRAMLGWTFGLGAFAVLVFINWGGSITETSRNFMKMGKSVLIFIVIVLVFGGLGQCIGSRRDGGDTGGVPDSWSRR